MERLVTWCNGFMRDVAGTMSSKADNSAVERADMERISEGNGNVREIQKTGERPWYITTLDEMPEPLVPWWQFVMFAVR